MTDVKPAGVNVVPPRDTGVVPIVIELLVNELFAILLIVFKLALIVLFVSVSVVVLATKVSVPEGTVTVPPLVIDEIVGAVSVNPPIVEAVPPNDTDVEPIVTELLVNDAFPIFDNVFDDALIVLLVNVCVPFNVATVPVSIAIVTAVAPE